MALKLDVTDTTLYSDRSICWLRLFVSEDALLDAEACISMRPKWAKDYFLLLEDHVGAAKALLNALKLDLENADSKEALQEALCAVSAGRNASQGGEDAAGCFYDDGGAIMSLLSSIIIVVLLFLGCHLLILNLLASTIIMVLLWTYLLIQLRSHAISIYNDGGAIMNLLASVMIMMLLILGCHLLVMNLLASRMIFVLLWTYLLIQLRFLI